MLDAKHLYIILIIAGTACAQGITELKHRFIDAAKEENLKHALELHQQLRDEDRRAAYEVAAQTRPYLKLVIEQLQESPTHAKLQQLLNTVAPQSKVWRMIRLKKVGDLIEYRQNLPEPTAVDDWFDDFDSDEEGWGTGMPDTNWDEEPDIFEPVTEKSLLKDKFYAALEAPSFGKEQYLQLGNAFEDLHKNDPDAARDLVKSFAFRQLINRLIEQENKDMLWKLRPIIASNEELLQAVDNYLIRPIEELQPNQEESEAAPSQQPDREPEQQLSEEEQLTRAIAQSLQKHESAQ